MDDSFRTLFTTLYTLYMTGCIWWNAWSVLKIKKFVFEKCGSSTCQNYKNGSITSVSEFELCSLLCTIPHYTTTLDLIFIVKCSNNSLMVWDSTFLLEFYSGCSKSLWPDQYYRGWICGVVFSCMVFSRCFF